MPAHTPRWCLLWAWYCLLPHVTAEYPGNFALDFRAGEGNVVRVPHESSMQGPLIDSFTVEMWVKVQPNSQLDSGRIVNLVGFPGRHPFVGLASDTGCACVQLKTSEGWYSYEGTTPIDDGEWHHIAATWDGTSTDKAKRQLALYVDAQLEQAGGENDDATEVPKTPEANGVTVVRTCNEGLCEEGMHIGGLYCCSGGGYTGRYLNGTLDEIRVWTRARTREQLATYMNLPLAPGDHPGCVHVHVHVTCACACACFMWNAHVHVWPTTCMNLPPAPGDRLGRGASAAPPLCSHMTAPAVSPYELAPPHARRRLLFYFPLDEAGMETGANVIESRALPWYGILGNAKGGGRPHWTVSKSPLSCLAGSRAPICKRIASSASEPRFPSVSATSDSYDAEDDDAEEEFLDRSAFLLYMMLTAAVSASAAMVLTYSHLTGTYPHIIIDGIHTLRGILGRGAAYEPASAAPVPTPVDWTWAKPPRADQAMPPAQPPMGSSASGGAGGVPASYGGL